MEQHGKNPLQNVIAIIPARFASTRLMGKLLLELAGKPLILHTLEQAKKARNVDRVIVATDDERIFQIVEASGNEAVRTSARHQSGSDRIAEVARNLPENSIIVNVQGDEPLISPLTIEKAVNSIAELGLRNADSNPGSGIQDPKSVDIATTCEPIHDISEVFSPNVVKVVTDNNGFALYFSRSPIPFLRDEVNKHGSLEKAFADDPGLLRHFRKHTGLYVYRREFLLKFAKMEQTQLEKIEKLEQLRALENGAKIKVVEVDESSIGIDTLQDLERIREILENRKSEI